MLDLVQQAQVIQKGMEYYRAKFPQRSEEYRQFKMRYSIPRIQFALQRIKEGTYSICMNCNEHIGDDRLIAVPAALLCIDCQQEFEKGQR